MNNRMAEINNRTNHIMQRLTIVNIIFLPLMFIASFYGMNFTDMPELDWKYAYPIVIAIMVLIAGGVILFFKRRGWI
jgi:magnesium transporter